MSIITFLAPKSSAGRTTAVMALASGFIEQGCSPLVIDATEEAQLTSRGETTLSLWYEHMLRTGVEPETLDYQRAADLDALVDLIEKETEYGPLARHPILIDTSARLDDLIEASCAYADLLIAPFTDALTAHRVSEAIANIGLGAKPVYGLRCAEACKRASQKANIAAFTAGRILQNGLPNSELFAEQSIAGHIPAMMTKLYLQGAAFSDDHPKRQRLTDACAAVQALKDLTTEVLLALNGYELHRRKSAPPRTPLPLRKLGELIST